MATSKPWDSTLKRLVHANPSAFVQWLLPGAVFVEERPSEIESLKREVDALIEVTANGQPMLLHIEFQTYNDATMAERLLLYNVLLMNVYQLPVLSCVIYLLRDGTVSQSPLDVFVPTGYLTHKFYFQSIEIGQFTPEDMFNMGSEALIALVPLTQGGTNRPTLLRIFEELKQQRGQEQAEVQTTEIEVIAFTLASFVLQRSKNIPDQEWLIRRFREMHDIMLDTPIMQEILREGMEKGIAEGLELGMEKGREEGREEGLELGRLEASRRILLILTEKRFPELVSLAQEQSSSIQDVEVINNLIVAISSAQNELEGYKALRGQM